MFSAGLEVDVDLFRKAQTRSIIFGLITTAVPLLLGTLFGLAFGYAIIPAIVVGSLLASHTLLGLSIIRRLGAIRLEPVIVTIGATVLSDTLSLIVFAICVPTYTAGFSLSGLAIQLLEIAVFVPLILFGLSRAGAYVLRKVQNNEDAEFVLMLGIMALAGMLADFIKERARADRLQRPMSRTPKDFLRNRRSSTRSISDRSGPAPHHCRRPRQGRYAE